MQFRDKTAYVWGLRYRWDPSLSRNPVPRFPHFMPPWCSVRRQSFAKPCPGLSERLFRPIIAQSFARFIIFTDDRTAKSSVNGLAVTLDRLIRLMRHLYIIWSGVDASILNYTEKNDNDEHCNHCIVSIIFLFGGKEEYIYDDDYLKKWPYTAHRAVVRSISSC